jgi:hypothetical protein
LGEPVAKKLRISESAREERRREKGRAGGREGRWMEGGMGGEEGIKGYRDEAC